MARYIRFIQDYNKPYDFTVILITRRYGVKDSNQLPI